MKRITIALVVALLLSPLVLLAQNTGNLAAQILASAARGAATVNSSDQANTSWQSAHIILNVSAWVSGNYTLHVQGKDPVSGNYYDLLVGNGVSTTGTTVYKIGPGISPLANASAQDMLPRTWRVSLVGASTPSMTFSVGAFLGEF